MEPAHTACIAGPNQTLQAYEPMSGCQRHNARAGVRIIRARVYAGKDGSNYRFAAKVELLLMMYAYMHAMSVVRRRKLQGWV